MKPMNLQQLPHRIINLVAWNSQSIGIVLDAPSVLLIPASPPGYCSARIQERDDIAIYKPEPCIPGTHKIGRSFGPCVMCSAGTKNNGSAGEMCVRCTVNDTSWCFAAAINEVDMTNITSYDQANPYPESPHTTGFDDILLQNIFQVTGYKCKDIALQQIRDRGLNTPFTNFNCSETNGILTIAKLLPQHVITLELTLNGPHFVGGLRLCFLAPLATNVSTHSKAQQMDTCQFFFTPNETLTRNPTVNVKMTKVINRTAGLMIPNNTTYTGLWLSSFMTDTLTDELLFSRDAEYLRYVPEKTILVVVITESEFYMKNTQEPIARYYEIAFNTVLFAIEIFISE
ncbi:unnamed protein product [Rotaria sordida]|uniref:Uncharacterized protein n=1 Tax=Rotaria sordida TaxID=392033 RepID=A0A819BPS1_9BILA|nr:unnamed protein product [Rotaria sordida]